ncbi:MAG: hypothetical protein ABIO72_01765 [Patescibacteria group bacterium]
MKLNPFIIVLIVLVVGGGAFYGGMKYQQSKIPAGAFRFTQGAGGQGGNFAGRIPGGAGAAGGFARGGAGVGLVNGEVLSKDEKSLTIKMRDGGSKIVFYSASTSVMTSSSSTVDSIETGKTVMINGTTNSDGSVTAQTINLR